jgi:clan AA aspartic protease (TIGR02281 family)
MKRRLGSRQVFSKHSFISAFLFLLLFGFNSEANADILYLKNGRSIEGVIVKEDVDGVNLEMSCGMVKFSQDQIQGIQRSSVEGTGLIKQKWAQEEEAAQARAKQVQEAKEHEPKSAALGKQSGHVTVEAMLNKKVKASLLLDTGASLVILSAKIASSLGFNPAPGNPANTIELVLADGRKLKAKKIILDSLSVQNSEIQKVEAAIIPEPESASLINDGFLGMSFLKNFSFKIDQKENKIILEKL